MYKKSLFHFEEKVGKQLREVCKILLDYHETIIKSKKRDVLFAKDVGEYKNILPEKYLDRIKELSSFLSLSTTKEEEEKEKEQIVKKLLRASIELPSLLEGACTTLAVSGEVTDDHKSYVGWNFDLPWTNPLAWIIKYTTVFQPRVIEYPDCYAYVQFGVPILFNIGVLNEKGLACVVNSAPHKKDCGSGLPYPMINNLVMEKCATVKEACTKVGRSKRLVVDNCGLNLNNLNLLFTDRKGTIALVESSHKNCKAHYSRDNESHKKSILGSANHHQFLDSGCEPPNKDEPDGSQNRLETMWSKLEQYSPEITVNDIKTILRTPPICNKNTVCSFIIEPEDYTVYFCKQKWKKPRNFTKDLKS